MADDAAGSAPAKQPPPEKDYIRIIPLPKIVFFYPTAIISLAGGIMMSFWGQGADLTNPPVVAQVAGWLFMGVFTANVMVISFDFPGVKFLAACFALVAVVLGVALTSVYYPGFIPGISDALQHIRLIAGAHFFYFMALMLGMVIFTSAMVARWTNIWYLHSNELVHKRGILGDVEKYPTINLRVTKEINDIFEFMLLLSGSLVLQPTTTDRPIVLENVWSINHKEKRIRDLLSKWRIDTT